MPNVKWKWHVLRTLVLVISGTRAGKFFKNYLKNVHFRSKLASLLIDFILVIRTFVILSTKCSLDIMGNFKILIEFLDPHKWDLLDLLNINSHAHAPGIKPAKTSFCSKVSITSGLLFSIRFRPSSNIIFRSQMTVRLDWLIISGRRLKSKSLLPMFSKTVPSRLTFHF